MLVARSEDKLQQLAKEVQDLHKIQVDVLVEDLTQPTATEAVFDAVNQKKLTIDCLINNAGFGDYGDFALTERSRQLQMIQLNILALLDLTHLFLQGMRSRRFGTIINVVSIAAF